MNELGNTPADKNYKPSGISRAEEAARDYILTSASPFPNTETAAVIYGYMRAEKDLALTWEDMKAITDIADKMMEEIVPHHSPEWLETEEKYYTEVLKRYLEAKK